MPLNIRERSQKVANRIKTNTRQTLQGIASATGLHRSSVYRHQQAIERRNQHPESSFWETEAGYQWLVRVVFGLVYYFGIKQGVGAESLSEFIEAIHLDTHIASSASSLRQLKQRMNQAVIDYAGLKPSSVNRLRAKASVWVQMKPSLACQSWYC